MRSWSGLFNDLIIEQVLMRSVKTIGGLTRGRGMTDAQRSIWLMSKPIMYMFLNEQRFTGKM